MSIIGVSKKEDYSKEKAKEMAVKAAKKSNPLMSKRKARKVVEKIDKKQNKGIKM